MKMITRIPALLICITLFIISCQKEVDWGIGNRVSIGSLQSSITGDCLGSTVSGNYKKDSVLNSGHYVTVTVDVDSAGTYSISTDTVNGYFFRAIGTFSVAGTQTVKLVGTGKPVIAGTNTFTVKYNGSTCQFSVNVAASTGGGGGSTGTSVYSIDCGTATLNGSYQATISMTPSNTVSLNVKVTTAGTWNLTSATANGISFSGSGNFTATGPQTITLTATGTPTASGDFNISVNSGSSTCPFQVTFTAAPVIDWKFTEGSVTYQGQMDNSQLQTVVTISTYGYSGSNANNDDLVFAIVDFSGGMNANETYNSNNTTGNSSGFVFIADSGEIYTADNTTSGVNLIFKVTSHNTSTKSIQGTFSGTVRNSVNAIKTITNGTFKGTYQ
jgi:hypothetical protein